MKTSAKYSGLAIGP